LAHLYQNNPENNHHPDEAIQPAGAKSAPRETPERKQVTGVSKNTIAPDAA